MRSSLQAQRAADGDPFVVPAVERDDEERDPELISRGVVEVSESVQLTPTIPGRRGLALFAVRGRPEIFASRFTLATISELC